ncbi:alpha/beta fold hydrolase [Nocardia sp. NPDC059177]|uniref:alpha/beta fold hydrolase n=1 Tax=Nocardia sp. NPDC059177 TaxID=3346759 RepID=UPI0036CB47F3
MMNTHTISVGDVAVHRVGDESGPQPVCVLAHGLEDGWQSWSGLIGQLASTYRCYLLDLPWRAGNTYEWRRSFEPLTWLERALRLIPEPIDMIVGHSLGANVILDLLCHDAAITRSAVLIAPFYRPAAVPADDRLREQSRQYLRQVIDDGTRLRLGSRAHRIDDDVRAAMVDKQLERIGPAGFDVLFDQVAASGNLPLDQIAASCTVIADPEDLGLAGGDSNLFTSAWPAANLRLLPRFGHFGHVTFPEVVAEAVRELSQSAPTSVTGSAHMATTETA